MTSTGWHSARLIGFVETVDVLLGTVDSAVTAGTRVVPTAADVATSLYRHLDSVEEVATAKALSRRWTAARYQDAEGRHRALPEGLASAVAAAVGLADEDAEKLRRLEAGWRDLPASRGYRHDVVASVIREATQARQPVMVEGYLEALAQIVDQQGRTFVSPAETFVPVRVEIARLSATSGQRTLWNHDDPPSGVSLVVGPPGYGKSGLLVEHARRACDRSRHAVARGSAAAVPVVLDASQVVRLGRLDEDEGRLWDAALETAGVVRHADWEQQGPRASVICIDGADSLTDEQLPVLARAVDSLGKSGPRVLVACQHRTYDALVSFLGEDVTRVRVLLLEPADVREVTRSRLGPSRADRLMRMIAEDPRLGQLCRVPLDLAVLHSAIESGQDRSTTGRAELLTRYVVDVLGGDAAATRDALSLGHGLSQLWSGWRARRGVVRRDRLAAQLAERWGGAEAEAILERAHVAGLLRAADTNAAVVRFPHTLVASALVALALADLPPRRGVATLLEHRWFDDGWDDVFVLFAELSPSGGPVLVDALLDEQHDLLSTQLLRASDCLVALTLDEARPRSVSALARLVPMAVGSRRRIGAVAAVAAVARRLGITHDELLEQFPPLRRVGWTLLCEMGRRGERSCIQDLFHGLLTEPDPVKIECAAALVEIGEPGVVDHVAQLAATASIDVSALREVLGLLHGATAEDLRSLLDIVSDRGAPIGVRRIIAEGLAAFPERFPRLEQVVSDARVPWSVRAAVAAGTIAQGRRVPPGTRALALSPNLSAGRSAPLLVGIAREDGWSDATIARAFDALVDFEVSDGGPPLAAALAASIPAAARLWKRIEDQPDAYPISFLALLESGHESAVAAAPPILVDAPERWTAEVLAATWDDGTAGQMLADIARVRLTEGDLDPDLLGVVVERLDSTTVDVGVIRALFGLSAPSLAPLGMRLAVTDPPGLTGLLRSGELPAAARATLAVGACRVGDDVPQVVLQAAEEILGENLPIAERQILAVSLVAAGWSTSPVLEVMVDPTHPLPGRDDVLLRLFEGPDATLEAIEYVLGSPVTTEGEAELFVDAARYNELEGRVGIALSAYLGQSEMATFEQLMEAGRAQEAGWRDGAGDWLSQRLPFMAIVVGAERDRLDKIAAEGVSTPDRVVPGSSDPVAEFAEDDPARPPQSGRLTARPGLEELLDGGLRETFGGDFRERAATWLGAGLSVGSTVELHGLDAGDFHGRAVRALALTSMDAARRPHALLRQELERGDGDSLLDLASFLVVDDPSEASSFFYGSLGALLAGRNDLAVWLMGECRSRLDPSDETRRRDGLRTIEETAVLHGLQERRTTDVLRAVLGG